VSPRRADDAPRVLRLSPGTDLLGALRAEARRPGAASAILVSGLGSLDGARLRGAGRDDALELAGDLELLTISGTLARSGVHAHLTVADADGRVTGGHLLAGCPVRTTAELLIRPVPALRLRRARDAASGHRELAVAPAPRRRARRGSPR
jgi:predicted DNA-binding protein with PD1-like motif